MRVSVLDINSLLLILIPLVSGGIGWLIRQSYKRSEERQKQMIEVYQKQAEKADARAKASQASEERAWAKCRAYWRLLVEHGIEPIPPIEDGDDL